MKSNQEKELYLQIIGSFIFVTLAVTACGAPVTPQGQQEKLIETVVPAAKKNKEAAPEKSIEKSIEEPAVASARETFCLQEHSQKQNRDGSFFKVTETVCAKSLKRTFVMQYKPHEVLPWKTVLTTERDDYTAEENYRFGRDTVIGQNTQWNDWNGDGYWEITVLDRANLGNVNMPYDIYFFSQREKKIFLGVSSGGIDTVYEDGYLIETNRCGAACEATMFYKWPEDMKLSQVFMTIGVFWYDSEDGGFMVCEFTDTNGKRIEPIKSFRQYCDIYDDDNYKLLFPENSTSK